MITLYDQMSSINYKQHLKAVSSVVEAILIRIEKNFLDLEEVVMQSDNERCCQNSTLLCGLMNVSEKMET